MIKGPNLNSIINEFVGSHIARLIIGENAPIVTLLKGNNKVYTASKFIPNFKTLQEFFVENDNLPRGCFPYSCVLDKNNSIIIVNSDDQTSLLNLMSPVINGAEALCLC